MHAFSKTSGDKLFFVQTFRAKSFLFLAGMSLDDDLDLTGENDYDLDDWGPRHSTTRGYPRVSDMTNRGFSGNLAGSSNSVYLHSRHHIILPSVREHVPPVKIVPPESVSLPVVYLPFLC